MDGPPLRQVTFRVQHDCPMARLSAATPAARYTNWSGHRLEVIEVRLGQEPWDGVLRAAGEHLDLHRAIPTPEGGLLVAGLHVEEGTSISRTLEAQQCIALQPMRVEAGWESYDAIAFGPGREPEQRARAALAKRWPTQVTRRRTIGPGDLMASLFQSLRPVLEAPTAKQAEALAAAARAGYYQAPRQATTAEVASGMGLGRSAFEERLRGAENRVLLAVAAAIEAHRLR